MSSVWDEPELHNQYLASFAASLGGLSVGASVGWTAPAQHLLVNEKAGKFSLSLDEFSWICGALWLGLAIPIGLLAKYIGRKILLLLVVGLVSLLGWVLLIFSPNIYFMIAARFLQGLAAGTYFIVTPLYNLEVAKPKTFMVLGSCLHELLYALGIFYAFVFGVPRHYNMLCYGCAVLPILFMVIFIWMPETPLYYVSKGKLEKAIESLTWLRGKRGNKMMELVKLDNEFIRKKNEGFIHIFKYWHSIKALIIGVCLEMIQHFTGNTPVISYVTFLFLDTGATDQDARLSNIGFAISMVLGTLFAILLLLYAMRLRILMILSITLVLLTSAALGLHALLRARQDTFLGHFSGLPITGFCIFIFCQSLGLGTLTYYSLNKQLRPQERTYCCSLVYFTSGIFGFISVKCFTNMLVAWGQDTIFFSYTAIGVLGLCFIYTFMPGSPHFRADPSDTPIDPETAI